MHDVTQLLLTYRDARVHLWNTYFVGKVHSLEECSILDRYEAIDRLLFSALVLDALGKGSFEKDFSLQPLPFLRVAPAEGRDNLKVMISEPPQSLNRVWNETAVLSPVGEAEFAFVELFEWDRYGFVIYPYYRVRIQKLPNYPDYVGRDALVETWNARVLFVEDQ
jgi:hypothetical protein